MSAWSGWYKGMGALEFGVHERILELQKRQDDILFNKRNYYNWELSVNRINCLIDKLYKQQEVAKILES